MGAVDVKGHLAALVGLLVGGTRACQGTVSGGAVIQPTALPHTLGPTVFRAFSWHSAPPTSCSAVVRGVPSPSNL